MMALVLHDVNNDNRTMNTDIATGAPLTNLFGDPPDPVWFHRARFAAGTAFPPMCWPWGRLLLAVAGIAEFDIAGKRYLSPPAVALWIPPDVEHASRTNLDIEYVAVHVAREPVRGFADGALHTGADQRDLSMSAIFDGPKIIENDGRSAGQVQLTAMARRRQKSDNTIACVTDA